MGELEFAAKVVGVSVKENRHGEPIATVTLKISGEYGEDFPGLNRLIGSSVSVEFKDAAREKEGF